MAGDGADCTADLGAGAFFVVDFCGGSGAFCVVVRGAGAGVGGETGEGAETAGDR